MKRHSQNHSKTHSQGFSQKRGGDGGGNSGRGRLAQSELPLPKFEVRTDLAVAEQ